MYYYAAKGDKLSMSVKIVIPVYFMCIIPMVIIGVSCLHLKRGLQAAISKCSTINIRCTRNTAEMVKQQTS